MNASDCQKEVDRLTQLATSGMTSVELLELLAQIQLWRHMDEAADADLEVLKARTKALTDGLALTRTSQDR